MDRLDSPFYFYDLDHFKSHLEFILSHLDNHIKLWYACKSNPLSAVLKVLRNLNFGIDVASAGELRQVLNTGIAPKNIIATGPAKSKKYFRHLLDHGLEVFVLESLNQAYWLNETAQESGKNPRVLLRIQLDWPQGTSVLGGGGVTPFGIEPSSWQKIDSSRISSLNIIGFHAFQWSNIIKLDQLRTIWWKTGEAIVNLSDAMGIVPMITDLGGGIGISYSDDTDSPDFREINALLCEFRKHFGFKTIWMELGRYLVGESGYYFTPIVDEKVVRGKRLLVTAGGINHMARPVLTGELFKASLFRKSDKEREEFTVHGPLCTALDNLGTFLLPRDSAPGDWIFFSAAGAYGLTESMPFFLCHDLPAEVVYYQGDMMIPRGVKTSSDWSV